MEITKGLSDSLIDGFAKTNVFAPRNLKSNLFTLIAKDNVDKNASSNTAVQHYHGISMTVMQFPSENSVGESRPSPIFHFTSNTPNKKVSPLPPSYVDIKPRFIPKRKIFTLQNAVTLFHCMMILACLNRHEIVKYHG